jgi:hypothetical protein
MFAFESYCLAKISSSNLRQKYARIYNNFPLLPTKMHATNNYYMMNPRVRIYTLKRLPGLCRRGKGQRYGTCVLFDKKSPYTTTSVVGSQSARPPTEQNLVSKMRCTQRKFSSCLNWDCVLCTELHCKWKCNFIWFIQPKILFDIFL